MAADHDIRIEVETEYLPEHSDPQAPRYVFAYHITLRNAGRLAARLLRRHWIITDGQGRVEEVAGEGVVGEQPELEPGAEYRYTSAAVLDTPIGTMRGRYHMIDAHGRPFEAPIPEFLLSVPGALH